MPINFSARTDSPLGFFVFVRQKTGLKIGLCNSGKNQNAQASPQYLIAKRVRRSDKDWRAFSNLFMRPKSERSWFRLRFANPFAMGFSTQRECMSKRINEKNLSHIGKGFG
jgi:hypothetical protein